jgi:protein-L-isoaspartate(D-aspartate) O-methyltransferase
MGQLKSFLQSNHHETARNYQERATDLKPEQALLSKKFDFEYWDGERNTGYGGYKDDGRWNKISSAIIEEYQLTPHASILDIGCGKGFLLNAFKQNLTHPQLKGIDISPYAIMHSAPDIRPILEQNSAQSFQVILFIIWSFQN